MELKFGNKFTNTVTESNPKPQESSLPHHSVLVFLADLSKSNPSVQDSLFQSVTSFIRMKPTSNQANTTYIRN